jgi:two-component system response regulator YesN
MKVLLVDDERHVQEAIHILLDWPKYGVSEVLYADNGKEALDILMHDNITIMFCDMRMPVMDGVQLLEEVRKRNMSVRVIAVSGYDDFQYTRATLLANGVDYVLKPFTRKSLEEAIELALAKHEQYSLPEPEIEDNAANPKVIHRYLMENYNRNITLTDIAEHFHMSCQHLSRIYKGAFGTTIISALTQMRMDMAKRLLKTTDTPVSGIAQKLGYEDENYFSKVFKKQEGFAPKQYRKKHKT